MEAIPTNTAIFSGRGFLPRLPDPASVVDVVAGSVRGVDDLARVRTAGLVRIIEPDTPSTPADDTTRAGLGGKDGRSPAGAFGRALAADDLVVRTVLWLALAGVPMTSEGLADRVRRRLDHDLMRVLDQVDAATVSDPGRRELLSMALRRRARLLVPHPVAPVEPAVAVLLPEDLPPNLAHDLDAQTWGAVIRCPARPGVAAASALDAARREGAVYCTRMDASLRYSPHHLDDLVDALRHSGTPVAHSPLRFRPWGPGAWLEDDAAAVEGAADSGLPDGSLWYAEDGPEPPAAPVRGYAMHGAGAVPAEPFEADTPAALRLHRDLPAVLGWLPVSLRSTVSQTAVPRSYFADS